MTYDNILVEQRGAVTLITLNRPKALNALNTAVLAELIAAFAAYDADASQRCAVLTGSERAFAAGADIKEMADQGFASMYASNFFQGWEKVTATRKPWIAAAGGYARGRGGGAEVRGRTVGWAGRCGGRCAGGRVRGGDGGVFHHRRRQCAIRSARDQARR